MNSLIWFFLFIILYHLFISIHWTVLNFWPHNDHISIVWLANAHEIYSMCIWMKKEAWNQQQQQQKRNIKNESFFSRTQNLRWMETIQFSYWNEEEEKKHHQFIIVKMKAREKQQITYTHIHIIIITYLWHQWSS